MTEILISTSRLMRLGDADDPGLLVSLSDRDVPSLSGAKVEERVLAAKREGAAGVYGDLDKLRSARQIEPSVSIGTLLEVKDPVRDVGEALAHGLDAVGTSYDLLPRSAVSASEIRLNGISRVVAAQAGGVFPVVASLYSQIPLNGDHLVEGIHMAKRLGAHAAIVPSTANDEAVIGKSPLPVFVRVADRRPSSPLENFRVIERAIGAGASGVVVGPLMIPTQIYGEQPFTAVLGGMRSVLNGVAPETVNRDLSRTRR